MANDFLRPEVIAATGLGLLRRELILPRLVTRLAAADFVGAKDDTVNIRVPAILEGRNYEWRTRTAPIVVDDLEELSIPVTLDQHVYNAVQVTDEELTLDIASFAVQVLSPQVIAVAEKLEAIIATVMVGASYAAAPVTYVPGGPDDAAFYNAAVDARKVLNDAHVPATGRVIVLGSGVEAAALKEDSFRKVDESGSNDALREAVIGRVAGFTVIGNVQSLPEDFALAFHPTAFGFANVAPAVPAGVAFGAGQTFEGFAMRWIRDYDSSYLRDRSVVNSFAGGASINDGRDDHGGLTDENVRAVLIDFQPGS